MTEKNISQMHIPVMLERTLELFAPALNGENRVLVDCTLGMGGHTEALLNRFAGLTVIGIDRDAEALGLAKERLEVFGDRVKFFHGPYNKIDEAVALHAPQGIDGVLFDLGVSSFQLDEPGRGFSYSKDAPLDMRMDGTEEIEAGEILNTYSERDLARLFSQYGEEPLAKRYAKAIVAARETERFETSARLVEVIQEATPYAKKNLGHPAKRIFQALRIAVNDEIRILEEALPKSLNVTTTGARVLAMSYHSLEDRIVKNVFRDASSSKTPAGVPVDIPELSAEFKPLTRKPETASQAEIDVNPRAKPVKVRAVERIRKS